MRESLAPPILQRIASRLFLSPFALPLSPALMAVAMQHPASEGGRMARSYARPACLRVLRMPASMARPEPMSQMEAGTGTCSI